MLAGIAGAAGVCPLAMAGAGEAATTVAGMIPTGVTLGIALTDATDIITLTGVAMVMVATMVTIAIGMVSITDIIMDLVVIMATVAAM